MGKLSNYGILKVHCVTNKCNWNVTHSEWYAERARKESKWYSNDMNAKNCIVYRSIQEMACVQEMWTMVHES